MIGFLIKKAFFDAWDNLIGIVVANLGFVVALILFTLDLGKYVNSQAVSYFMMFVSLLLLAFHSVGVGQITFAYSNYKREGFDGYKEGLRLFWRHALVLFGLNIFIFILALIVIPFYYSMGNIFGLVLCIVLCWVLFTTVLAIQYFLPLMTNFTGDKPIKTFKKCFIMAIGNLGTSIFLLIFNTIQTILTVVTAGLLFNVTGITLANQDAFKLLLLKLDYIEEQGEDADLKNLPWEEILYEEKESVGARTLKGMIFPWKD